MSRLSIRKFNNNFSKDILEYIIFFLKRHKYTFLQSACRKRRCPHKTNSSISCGIFLLQKGTLIKRFSTPLFSCRYLQIKICFPNHSHIYEELNKIMWAPPHPPPDWTWDVFYGEVKCRHLCTLSAATT
jgi:hypothetical protein